MVSPVVVVEAPRARALRAACAVLLIATLAVGTAAVVRAAAPSAVPAPSELFGVHPDQEGRTTLPGGHFNFALVPGQSVSDGIVVENFSSHTLSFHVYGADLLTAIGGGLAPAQSTATMRAVGAWIVVSAPTLSIAAHAQSTDPFTITVPPTASVGQHLGAVVAAADVGVTAEGTPIEARAALMAVVTLPGVADPSAHLTPLFGSDGTAGRVGFDITLSNTGNLLLTYAGVLVIDDAGGHRVATLPLSPTSTYVVPNGEVRLAAIWKEPTPLAEMYRAQARVTIFANAGLIRTLTSQSLALRLAPGDPPFVPIALALATAAMMLLAAWLARGVVGRRHRSTAPRVLRTGPVA